MIKFSSVTKLVLRQPVRYFVNDKFFKERDEAAEKVYLSQQESKYMLQFRVKYEKTFVKTHRRQETRPN